MRPRRPPWAAGTCAGVARHEVSFLYGGKDAAIHVGNAWKEVEGLRKEPEGSLDQTSVWSGQEGSNLHAEARALYEAATDGCAHGSDEMSAAKLELRRTIGRKGQ